MTTSIPRINDTLEVMALLSGWSSCLDLVHIDDIVIIGKTFQQHLDTLQLVLKQQGKYKTIQNLIFFFTKKFSNNEGYRISQEGITKDQAKMDGVSKWLLPKTEHLQRWLGLVGSYRRSISDFAGIANPQLHWHILKSTQECSEALDRQKTRLMSLASLSSPSFM